MGDFSTDWLALRESADSRARSTRLVGSLLARLAAFTHAHAPGADRPRASPCAFSIWAVAPGPISVTLPLAWDWCRALVPGTGKIGSAWIGTGSCWPT